MNVLVLHDTCTELVSYCISCCLVHQLSSLSGMLSTINRVSSKTEHTVIAKCPLVNTTLRYSRQDLHSLVQHKPCGWIVCIKPVVSEIDFAQMLYALVQGCCVPTVLRVMDCLMFWSVFAC